ncbi:MAG: hypothetical protein V4596_13490 [Bdellovibrionota bacterium]
MQIIFLVLVSVLLVNCSSKENGAPIPESNVRLLRKSNSEVIQVTDKSQLEASDYILFDTEKNKNITIQDLGADQESPYSISSVSECKISDKLIRYSSRLNQHIIELKSILPLEFFLSRNSQADCSFQIILNHGGSSKTFSFSNTTIKNKNTNTQALLGDQKVIELKQLPTVIDEDEFENFTITRTNTDESVSLICENFYSKPIRVQNEIVKFETMARYMEIVSILPIQVDPRIYIPHQDCVVYLRRNNGSVYLSSPFKVRYTVMQPQVSFVNNPYTQRDPPDRYAPFSINFSNPHAVPTSIAIDKTKLSLNVTVTVETCPRDKCRDDVKGTPTPNLDPQFSNPESVIEKENAYIVYLRPNETFRVIFWTLIYDTYHSEHRIEWNLSTKKDLIQNLHTNYQTPQEIPDHPKFIGTAGSNL